MNEREAKVKALKSVLCDHGEEIALYILRKLEAKPTEPISQIVEKYAELGVLAMEQVNREFEFAY